MRTFVWLCIFLSWITVAQGIVTRIHSNGHDGLAPRFDHNGADSPAEAPSCTESCRKQFPLNTSEQCTYEHVFTSRLTRCVQKSCPTLQEVLDWQTYHAAVCHLSPRDEGLFELGIAWALFGLATICVILRFLSRSRYLNGPGFWWDDWTVLFFWILTCQMAACLVPKREAWSGRDAFGVVDAADVRELLKWTYVSVPVYIIGTYGAKIGWVMLYMRMWEFKTPFRCLCWFTILVLVCVTVAFTIGATVCYWPLHYYIGHSPIVRQFHQDIDMLPVVFSIAAINIFMDIWVLMLPIPKLMSLTGVSRQRKIGICAVFALGLVATACSIIRVKYIVPLKNTTNATWDFGHFIVWCEIEIHLGMVSCNLPMVAGLISRLRSRYWAPHRVNESDQSGNTYSTSSGEAKTMTLGSVTFDSTSSAFEERSDSLCELAIPAPAVKRRDPN